MVNDNVIGVEQHGYTAVSGAGTAGTGLLRYWYCSTGTAGTGTVVPFW